MVLDLDVCLLDILDDVLLMDEVPEQQAVTMLDVMLQTVDEDEEELLDLVVVSDEDE